MRHRRLKSPSAGAWGGHGLPLVLGSILLGGVVACGDSAKSSFGGVNVPCTRDKDCRRGLECRKGICAGDDPDDDDRAPPDASDAGDAVGPGDAH